MRALILGSGFIGRSLGRELDAHGCSVTLASRQGRAGGAPWLPLDVTDRGAYARVLAAVQPDVVVLVHGPSDITWCEDHEEEAVRAHVASAHHLCQEASGCYKVLISTDNIFSGTEERYDETCTPEPANAYGRAKATAERVLLHQDPDALILRLSLVYGWEDPESTKWLNFFALSVSRLLRGERVRAPADHWNTPVLVDDAALVGRLLMTHRRRGVYHLGGPDRVSRVEWARENARVFGCDPRLVEPTSKAESRYACRPTNACLESERLGQLAELADVSIAGIVAGAERLKATMPTSFQNHRGASTHATD